MTTATLTRFDPAAGSAHAAAAAVSAALLSEQARAGAHVAWLSEDAAGWDAAVPLVAQLAACARHLAARVSGAAVHAAAGGTIDAGAPSVLWAREVGATQLRLRTALRDLAESADADAATVAVMLDGLQELRALSGALADLAAAPATARP